MKPKFKQGDMVLQSVGGYVGDEIAEGMVTRCFVAYDDGDAIVSDEDGEEYRVDPQNLEVAS